MQATMISALLTLLSLAPAPQTGAAQRDLAPTKLLRFPDIHGDRVAFCYGGDLWSAPAAGGSATRLTAHEGQELFPKFSPDGKWIAFTGQYDGDEQVYVIPSGGGIPKRLTYYPARGPLPPRWGYDHQVYGWTPDGTAVLFRGLRDAGGGSETKLYTVSVEGGLPVPLPMPTSGAGDFDPQGRRMVYSPLFRDFRHWKRYQGGWAQDLWIFDLETHHARKIAESKRTERDPMWIGENVYFASDRSGTLNLYRYDPRQGAVEALTHSTTWDLRWPSTDHKNRIVYELNGELEVYDVDKKTTSKLQIHVPDDGLARRPSRISASNMIENFQLSPKGERALICARGDIFTVPIERGPTRNLTNSSNAHDRLPRWSPDGSKIAFLSDLSGEEELYLMAQDGSGEPEALTDSGQAMRFAPWWSPDGQFIAFSDKDGKLWVVNVETKELVEVADARAGFISDYVWAPSGSRLAFSMPDANGYSSLYIYEVEDRKLHRITEDTFDEFEPVWDPGGDFLYYLGRREFAPLISRVEWNFAGNRQIGVFALALRRDVANPFAPRSDEVSLDEASSDDTGDEKKEDAKDDSEDGAFTIDYDGLASRVVRLLIDAGNYSGLFANEGHVFFSSSGAAYYGRSSDAPTSLQAFSLKDRETSTLVSSVSGYAMSADLKKMLIREGGAYRLYDAKAGAKGPKTVSMAGLRVDRVPVEEWETIFDEVWRRFRDFFYVPNMHGYDWKAIGDRYRALLPHVAHRSDLNYVIAEMIAELNVGHAYIMGGDYEQPARARVGLPGARFELDSKVGRFRITEIFEGDNAESKYRSPLRQVGVDASVGDYVLAIDGQTLEGSDNPYRLLQHKADPVTLTLSVDGSAEKAREVRYEPLSSEANLIYLRWVNHNRRYVSEKTGGRVGYIHIPDMGANGAYEFVKWFYPQIRKEGMVVDVRSNGGGNISQWIIERLDTRLLGTRFGRTSEDCRTYPNTVFHGHLVCLLNETSASDGDIFPHRFREAGLGPLIGKRSWGGVVGISGRGPLLDGGDVRVPEFATNGIDGQYVIEGHGVDPDIIVENDPEAVIRGEDPQLDRGIREVLDRMATNPRSLPQRPADPVKTR